MLATSTPADVRTSTVKIDVSALTACTWRNVPPKLFAKIVRGVTPTAWVMLARPEASVVTVATPFNSGQLIPPAPPNQAVPRAIWGKADPVLRDAMDLAYLTGQRPADVLRMAVTDVRDGALHVQQGKTRAKLRIEVAGELAAVIERLRSRKAGHKVYSTRLVVNEYGKPIGVHALSVRFARARDAAKVAGVQFRDLRAKAATDKADTSGDVRQAQKQLGHTSVVMTEAYTRKRRGEKVTPTR